MRRPLPVGDEARPLPTVCDEQLQRCNSRDRGALAELPERQRQAVVLRYLYGLRYGEVATALGLSRPATEALLFRARRALRCGSGRSWARLVVPSSSARSSHSRCPDSGAVPAPESPRRRCDGRRPREADYRFRRGQGRDGGGRHHDRRRRRSGAVRASAPHGPASGGCRGARGGAVRSGGAPKWS